MVFLNLVLAGGLAAVSAPIIIHLLHRSRVVPYDWGAMMFLQELMAERARRLRLREILLLLVRALIVACLALALMRPAVLSSSAGVRSPGVNTSAVVLLDDSYSMNAGRAHAAWQDAREMALAYLNTLRKGDDVSIMCLSSAGKAPAPAALYDLERAKELVRAAAPRCDKTDMPRAITAALRQLEAQHNPRRELVLFSDMQAAGWDLSDGPRWSFVANAVHSSRVPPAIILASTPDARPANLALLRIEPSRQVVDCYSPVTFSVTVVNGGAEEIKDATVAFSVDHAPKATRSVSLAPGAHEVLAFEHKFERPGSHCVTCRLRAAQDALDDDNELAYSVVVIEHLPVLLVDGDRREGALASETDFLRLALSPKDAEDPLWRTVIEPTVVDTADTRYADFSKYRVIVLANVAVLPAPVISELERFVVAGGGLLITLGDRVQPAAYNRTLFRQGAGLLPVALKDVAQSSGLRREPIVAHPVGLPVAHSAGLRGDPEDRPAEPARLGGIVSNAAALDLFRPEKGQDWSRARVRSYFRTAAPGEGARALASYSSGDLALVQKQLGEGKVLLLTTAVDLDWSDLPVHPFYVPLMQNLVFELASAVIPPRNLPVGQALVYVASGPAALKPHLLYPPAAPGGTPATRPAGAGETPALRTAGVPPAPGEGVAMKMQRQGALSVFTWEDTSLQGLYTVAPESAAPEERVYYTVTADRAESSLARLAEADFLALERDLGARRAAGWDELARLVQLDAGGYELSKYLLLAAISLCFLEVFLTRRWG
ncbi:MAG: BatA domain-containing protein [Planctomycetota bacterium]